MEFSEFAASASDIEAETADLDVVALVADLFADAGGDLPVVARFVQGRVFPAHSMRKLDIGPSLCYEALARAAGQNITPDDVEDRLADMGDIGEVAASLELGGQAGLAAFGGGNGGASLTVESVYDDLDALAATEGSGSRDEKITILFGLFNECSPAEARYLARIVLGEMRIGVGEGTVRDAISEAFDVPVEEVERALQVSNDYGLVAEVARDEGVAGLSEMQLEIGRPVQAMLAQAGTVVDALDAWEEAAVEWKYDGARCISGYTPVFVKGRGALAVRDIEVGDEVLTHKGRFNEVLAKNKRTIDSDERVFRFSTYLGEDFKITEGHELYAHTGDGAEWLPVEELHKGDWVRFPVPEPRISTDPPSKLTLRTVSNYEKSIELTDDFFRFLGYWVGDGSTNQHNHNQRIRLIFSNDDQEIQQEYREIVSSTLSIDKERIGVYDHGGATDIYWTDAPFRKWLSEHFRKRDQDGWRDKRVPDWFWNISASQFDSFLRGWFEADGHEDKRGRRSIDTKERDLASTIQLIGVQFGRIFGFSRIRRDDKTYYRLSVVKSERHARFVDDGVLVRILKREELSRTNPREVDPRQVVYNLHVEGDESYCVPMIALHNCQLHHDPEGETRVYSRNMEDVTDALPEVVELANEALDVPAIVDGEVVAIDEDGTPLPFQEILRRFRRKHDIEATREEVGVELRAFDCLHADGEDLLDAPLTARHARLAELLDDPVSELTITDDADVIAEIDAAALDAGHEGIMLKNPDSTYSPGRRGKNWLKRKPDVETLDLVVTGAEWGEGRRASFLGTFLLSAREGDGYVTIGKVATGIDDEELVELTDLLEPHILTETGQDVGIEPAVVFEVGFEEIQTSPTYESGYALRFPRFLGVRSDKDPSDADSMERVERLMDGDSA